MRPRVGVSRRLAGTGPVAAARDLDAACAAALAEADAEPVALAPGAGSAADLDGLGGLLIPGGPDFLPERPYPAGVAFDAVHPAQLAGDRALLAAAGARGLPLLGICYGMQLLALAGGGSLHHHLALDAPGEVVHHVPGRDVEHAISIAPGSRLAWVLGPGPQRVNSRHHQGVAAPGPHLRVAARAADGLCEALEAPGEPFVLGVQWHPERMPPGHRRPLFAAFVAACAGRPA